MIGEDITTKSLDRPDETRQFGHGELAVTTVADVTVGRTAFQPGFRWSTDVRPIAGTPSCELEHKGYVLSGQMCVQMDGGTEVVLKEGDVFVVEPGHDAWVVGNEPCVIVDWAAGKEYARAGDGSGRG